MRYNSGKLKQIKQLIREDKLNLAEKEIEEYRKQYSKDNELKYYEALLLKKNQKKMLILPKNY